MSDKARAAKIHAALQRQHALIRATEEKQMRALAKKLGFKVVKK